MSRPRILDRTPARNSDLGRAALGDPWMLLVVVCLLSVGLMSLYSIGSAREMMPVFRKQVLLVAIGLVPFAVFWSTDIGFWRKATTACYVLNLVLLAAVIAVGQKGGGAQRWVEIGPLQFQPSEMSKLMLVLTLSSFYAGRIDEIKQFGTFALSFLHVLPSLVLVFLQPHLGATLVLLVTWIGISIVAGVSWKSMGIALVAFLAVAGAAVSVPGVLKDYQKERIRAMFIHDEQGSDYQAMRAAMAFAAGGFLGTGYGQGEQKARGFVPEQHNDFIFSVVGEEGGLIVCAMVIAGFGFLFYRIWWAMYQSIDVYGRMLAAGVLCVLGFHTLVNIGMNLQLLPVVGLWLPFLSYGGTAIWLCLALVGLAQSVARSAARMSF